MLISDYLRADCVVIDRSAADKRSTLSLLADLVVARGLVSDRGGLMAAILAREAIVSTGVGGGVAIPHADLPEIEAPRLALGIFPDGVDFDALDEEPVCVVFLLLGTPRTPGLHMKILARIARLSKDPGFRPGLCVCRSGEEAAAFLAGLEARH